VFEFAQARLSSEPVEGTREPAIAEIPKKMQPSRLIDGSDQPERPHPCPLTPSRAASNIGNQLLAMGRLSILRVSRPRT